ncbi:MAG: glycosyltransferase family 4 protein [Acidimicrobiaceae bacterium]|nr:glycosyltransferase family 4 protein [Acidimicrobiaceae bacterium]
MSLIEPKILSTRKNNKLKLFANKLFFLLFCNDHIKNDSLVIDSFGLPYEYKKRLQEHNCKMVLNHAGSVNAYAEYFMEKMKLRGGLESYLNHVKTYDHVLFQSNSQALELDSLLGSGDERTLVVRPSASENDIQACKSESNLLFKNNKVNITVVGSVQRRKGQDFLVPIAQKLDELNCEYVINVVGNVLEKDFYCQLLKAVTTNGLSEKIVFHGFQSDHLSYMNDSDIVLQVSREEGVSRILREAMALGKAIVSFRLGGTAELLEENFDCFLAEPEQVDEITNKLYQLINDGNKRLSLGRNARLNFEEKYSYASYSKEVNKLVRLMVGK